MTTNDNGVYRLCRVAFLLALSLLAVEVASDELHDAPGLSANLEPLQGLLGRWSSVAWVQSDDGEWSALPPGEVVYTPALGGKFIAGKGVLVVPVGTIEFEEIFGYDPFQATFRMSWNDAAVGLMDVYEGDIEDGKLLVSNLETGTFWTTPDGTSYAFRLVIDVVPVDDRRTVEVYSSSDGGEGWSLYQRTVYERLPAPGDERPPESPR